MVYFFDIISLEKWITVMESPLTAESLCFSFFEWSKKVTDNLFLDHYKILLTYTIYWKLSTCFAISIACHAVHD